MYFFNNELLIDLIFIIFNSNKCIFLMKGLSIYSNRITGIIIITY